MSCAPDKKSKHVASLFFSATIFVLSFAYAPNSVQDSLVTKTYKELTDLSEQAFQKGDSTQLSIYRSYHLTKARLEYNKLEMARAYSKFITWNDFENDRLYCDSVIQVTKDIDHIAYPTTGYLLRANVFYYASDFHRALGDFIKGDSIASNKGDVEGQKEALLGIADVKQSGYGS